MSRIVYFFDEDGDWHIKPIDYDWKLVAELLNDFINEMLK